ncbi:MAG: DUF3089 domain-containing protein [Frankia sp.]|nr:DUF3089 domain-containing protein [Frankia sp.]
MRRCSTFLLAVLALLLGSACAQPRPSDQATTGESTVSPAPVDTRIHSDLTVAHPTVWVCRPGMVAGTCESDLDATVVDAHGPTGTEPFELAAEPKADCFYVYPTTSRSPLANAPLKATETEVAMVRAQAARFGSVCRVFAPAYQQYSVVARFQSDGPSSAARNLAYLDVRSAWHDYLLNDNRGRPVVLLGHDQGAEMLLRLLREEISVDPGQRALLVSAMLIGVDARVVRGTDTGGDLGTIPACRRHDQVGCVVAYSAYANDAPQDAMFGRPEAAIRGEQSSPEPGKDLAVLCTNPAALGGGPAALRPYLPTARLGGSHLSGQPEQTLPVADTAFVTYPNFFWAECRESGDVSWLAVVPFAQPDDVRSLPVLDSPPSWGLHQVEFNLALGDLIALAGRQTAAYLAERRPS